jgi:lambda repressor-like predicted transcriptional regulator
MSIRLYDAHNHLQDARLAPHREAILAVLQREGVAAMVVNGSCEDDWPEVLALARLHTVGDSLLRLSPLACEGAVAGLASGALASFGCDAVGHWRSRIGPVD